MNLNPIIKTKLNDFRVDNGLTNLDDSTAFEYFVNYHILFSLQNDCQSVLDSLASVSIGGGNDIGLDGISLLIDGRLFSELQDIKDYLKNARKVEMGFVFIQSKYREKCDSGEFLKFAAGIKDFLSESPTIPHNESIKSWLTIKEYVLSEECIRKLKSNLSISAYYVYIGDWKGDPTILGHKDNFIVELKNMSFQGSDVVFVDSNRLHKLCNENENSFEVSLQYREYFPLEFDENEASNAGVLLFSAREFTEKVLLSESEALRTSLFYDNVRDFQGGTTVNNEIAETVGNNPRSFHLLNNGIVIVCDNFNTLGNKQISLATPQIVNGCQTCNVLYECYKNGIDLSSTSIMAKVISTQVEALTNKIVKSANKQNIVPDAAFETTREFHKNLEEFFKVTSKAAGINFLYERRSKQYRDLSISEKVNFRLLIQSFVSTFLQAPHLGHNHEFSLLNNELVKNRIFRDGQAFLPYYAATRLTSRISRSNLITRQWVSYKMQIAYAFCLVAIGQPVSLSKRKDVEDYSRKLLESVEDDATFTSCLSDAISKFSAAKDSFENKYAIKDTERFTNHLCDTILKSVRISSDLPEQLTGYIEYTGIDRSGCWFGFISRENAENVFFHERQNPSLDFSRIKNLRASYTIGVFGGKEFADNIMVESKRFFNQL